MSAEQWFMVVVCGVMVVLVLTNAFAEWRWHVRVRPILKEFVEISASYQEVLAAKDGMIANLKSSRELMYGLHEQDNEFQRTFVDQEQVDKVLGRLMSASREEFLRSRTAAEERSFQVHLFPVDALT